MGSCIRGRPVSLCLGVALALAGCGDGEPTNTEWLSPSQVQLQVVSGNGQSGEPGQMLPEPLVVRVVDGSGNPVAMQVVNFRVTSGGGSVFGGVNFTNGDGIARERWTLGGDPSQPQKVEVRAVDPESGNPITFATFTASFGSPGGGTAGGTVTSVTVSPPADSVLLGESVQLAATVKDVNGQTMTGQTVAWSSSNTAVATVSSSGLVMAQQTPGVVTITASSGGRSGSSSITVQRLASVEVAPASHTLKVGDKVQLTATLKDSNGGTITGRTVTWSSSNGAVASVTGDGTVTASAAGSATITATFNGIKATAQITVEDPVSSVEVSPSTGGLLTGETLQLTATPRDAGGQPVTGRTVTWSSSNAAVATVSSSGLVSATGVGTATITASTGGKSGTARIEVRQLASIEVAPAADSILAGETVQLTATLKDTGGQVITGRTVTWSSSSSSLATVSSSGQVTGQGTGVATITASYGGKSGSARITVQKPGSVDVSPPVATILGTQNGVQLTATIRDDQGGTITGHSVTWSSSNEAVAAVSSTGYVTGKSLGVARITATFRGLSDYSEVTVAVADGGGILGRTGQ